MPKTHLTESKRPRAGETAIARIAPPDTGTVEHFDSEYPGLALRISYGGRRSWTHFYRINGRQRRRTLGTYPELNLEAARDAWREDRKLIRDGRDPEEERRRRTVEAAAERERDRTFAEAVAEYRRHYLDGERGLASASRVEGTLLREAHAWHDRPIASITSREVGALLRRVRDNAHTDSRGRQYDGRPGLANRLHAYLSTFFGWCARDDVEYVKESPVKGVHKPHDEVEASREVCYTPEQLGALWRATAHLGDHDGAFLRLMLLTGKRKGALAAMRWEEIGDDWWNPPQPKRRNQRRETKHHWPIPLSTAAHAVLARVPRIDDCPYVFEGRHHGKPMSPGRAFQDKVRAASGVNDFFPHGVRHTVITLARGEVRAPVEVIDRYTDHSPNRGTGRDYDHGDGRDELHDLADAWGRYVRLVGRRRVWAAVSDHLNARDVPADDRRAAQRQRRREFAALIVAGGDPWIRWVRSIARPSTAANVTSLASRGRAETA